MPVSRGVEVYAWVSRTYAWMLIPKAPFTLGGITRKNYTAYPADWAKIARIKGDLSRSNATGLRRILAFRLPK